MVITRRFVLMSDKRWPESRMNLYASRGLAGTVFTAFSFFREVHSIANNREQETYVCGIFVAASQIWGKKISLLLSCTLLLIVPRKNTQVFLLNPVGLSIIGSGVSKELTSINWSLLCALF